MILFIVEAISFCLTFFILLGVVSYLFPETAFLRPIFTFTTSWIVSEVARYLVARILRRRVR